jgi:hypothetical protein
MVPSASASPPQERQRYRAWVLQLHFLQLAPLHLARRRPQGSPAALLSWPLLPSPSLCTDMLDGSPGWARPGVGSAHAGRQCVSPREPQRTRNITAERVFALPLVCGAFPLRRGPKRGLALG